MDHTDGNKTKIIQNTLIVGQSSTFNCTKDVYPNDFNTRFASTIKSFASGLIETGKIGIIWSDFNRYYTYYIF
jgi:hypothetical protein